MKSKECKTLCVCVNFDANEQNLHRNHERLLLILAAIACHPVEQDETCVYLVLLQVEAPAAGINRDVYWQFSTRTISQNSPHLARVPPFPRRGQLNLCQQPVSLRIEYRVDDHVHRQNDHTIHERRATHLNSERRKRLEGMRLRYMLIPETSKPVI